MAVKTSIGSTDIDVIGKDGEYILVAGGAYDKSKMGKVIAIYQKAAGESGAEVKAYLSSNTRQDVIDLAKKKLGDKNVVIMNDPAPADLDGNGTVTDEEESKWSAQANSSGEID